MWPRTPKDGGPPGDHALPELSPRHYLASGTPAVAFTDGVVVKSDNQGRPQRIRIDHGNGIQTEYRHLFRRDVRVGDRVRQGQRIGVIGHNPEGFRLNHLHFVLLKNGKAIDPEPTLQQVSAVAYPTSPWVKAGLAVAAVGVLAGGAYWLLRRRPDLFGELAGVRLPDEMQQIARSMQALDKLQGKPVKPLKCYGTHGYVAAKGNEYTSAKLTKAETDHLFSVIDRSCMRFAKKQCFYNSQMIADSDTSGKLKYVEGYVVADRVPFPIHHGWLDLNGKVVDLTLRLTKPRGRGRLRDRTIGVFSEGREYYGVTFPTNFIRRRMVETGEAGTVIDDWTRGFPLFKKEGCF